MPHSRPETAMLPKSKAVKPIPVPDIDGLAAVLKRKLQGPLIPPKTKIVKHLSPAAPIQWPAIKLDCIIASDKSKVAVFSIGEESFQCELGDEFQSISVKDISAKSVALVFKGQSRTMSLDEATDLPGESQ